MATKFVTGKVRFSFCYFHKTRTNDRGEEKYSTTVIIPKSDGATITKFRACEAEAARNKFPNKTPEFYKALKSVLHDGDGLRPTGEPFGPECKNSWVFTASSNDRPEIVDVNAQPFLEQVKSGDYGRVSINMYGFDTKGNKGVAAGLNNVQFLERGESLTGRTDAATDFGGGDDAPF